MEHVEGETLFEILLKARPEETVSPLEEIPCVVKLNATQPGKSALVIFGAEVVIDDRRREDNARANGAEGKLIVLDKDGI